MTTAEWGRGIQTTPLKKTSENPKKLAMTGIKKIVKPQKIGQKVGGGLKKQEGKVDKNTEKQKKALLDWLGGGRCENPEKTEEIHRKEGNTEKLAQKFGETRAQQKQIVTEKKEEIMKKVRQKMVRRKVNKIEAEGGGGAEQRGPLLKTGGMRQNTHTQKPSKEKELVGETETTANTEKKNSVGRKMVCQKPNEVILENNLESDTIEIEELFKVGKLGVKTRENYILKHRPAHKNIEGVGSGEKVRSILKEWEKGKLPGDWNVSPTPSTRSGDEVGGKGGTQQEDELNLR